MIFGGNNFLFFSKNIKGFDLPAKDYIAAYNYTFYYMTEILGVHNLLWAYAPSKPGKR